MRRAHSVLLQLRHGLHEAAQHIDNYAALCFWLQVERNDGSATCIRVTIPEGDLWFFRDESDPEGDGSDEEEAPAAEVPAAPAGGNSSAAAAVGQAQPEGPAAKRARFLEQAICQ
jgi:hypothetical protein